MLPSGVRFVECRVFGQADACVELSLVLGLFCFVLFLLSTFNNSVFVLGKLSEVSHLEKLSHQLH